MLDIADHACNRSVEAGVARCVKERQLSLLVMTDLRELIG